MYTHEQTNILLKNITNYTPMKNTNTNIDNMNLNPEVTATLKKYNTAIDGALQAVQKLESICVTAHLAELFWVDEQDAAKTIKEDYLTAA